MSVETLSLATQFDFSLPTRVLFGPGSLAQVGTLAHEYGGNNVLVVTDKGLAKAGHGIRTLEYLHEAGLEASLFDEVSPNPTTEDVNHTLEAARTKNIDLIIGLGGGSSMDCAKGCNFLLTNGGRMEDYWGVGKATQPMLPFIAIPTTAGTGSEAQSFALIAQQESHMKMACGDKKAAAKVAILDPELTVTMPDSVAAVTAIDALSHAVETYVTRKRNSVSTMFSRQAWVMLTDAFPKIFRGSADLIAREQMLLGAHWAGAAIEQSMLGAAHALANPLSAHFNTIHGVAIGIMLPHVIRYNANVAGPLYGELASAAKICSEDDSHAPARLADYVEQLVAMTGIPTTLKDAGINRELIPTMAAEAVKQWTGTFNPRELTVPQMQELYECAWTV